MTKAKTYIRSKYVDPFYISKEWKIIRRYMVNLYNHRCSKCGIQEIKGLQVDHIIPRKVNPALALDIRNLRCLCRKCHTAAGTSMGRNGSGFQKKYNAYIGEDGFANGEEWN